MQWDSDVKASDFIAHTYLHRVYQGWIIPKKKKKKWRSDSNLHTSVLHEQYTVLTKYR